MIWLIKLNYYCRHAKNFINYLIKKNCLAKFPMFWRFHQPVVFNQFFFRFFNLVKDKKKINLNLLRLAIDFELNFKRKFFKKYPKICVFEWWMDFWGPREPKIPYKTKSFKRKKELLKHKKSPSVKSLKPFIYL